MTRVVKLVCGGAVLGLLIWSGVVQATLCQSITGPSNPDEVYIDHGDGTVTDTRTGLMWRQCSEGQNGANCEIGSVQMISSWADALRLAEASSFAGRSDWRLPNVKELYSLVEECRTFPTINVHRFPNTPSVRFWSGSPFFDWLAFQVHFGHSSVSWVERDGAVEEEAGAVRLVRGGL